MKRLLLVTFFVLCSMQTGAFASPAQQLHVADIDHYSATPAAVASGSVGVIVRFRQPSTAPAAAQLLSAINGSAAAPSNREHGLFAFRTPGTQTAEQFSLQLMLEAPGVAYAEPNYVMHPASYVAPTDPDFTDTGTWVLGGTDYYVGGKHWWISSMEASAAWSIGQGATYPVRASANDIKVAVIDTGIYLTHSEFAAGTVTAGRDECASYNPSSGALTTDLDITPEATSDVEFASHGTGVAATIGAEINGAGMVGIGWNPKVYGYKIAGLLTSPWDGYPAGSIVIPTSAMVNGIYDATDAGCKVINISMVSPDSSVSLQDAVNYAHAHGVVVVAAAGNEGDTTVNYPAACDNVVGVGALSLTGGSSTANGALTRSSFSDFAPNVVDLAAPGEVFWTADKPGYDAGYGAQGYQFWAGTSFASPAVAGAIAYLWRAMPDLTNDQIVGEVESSAVDLGTTGRDDSFGYGLADMRTAYNHLISDYPTLAAPTITAASYLRNGQGVSWGAVSGYNVGYRVSIDGGPFGSAQTSTTCTLSSLADGPHTISVVPTSSRNWNTGVSAQTTLMLDSTAPVLHGFTFDGASLAWSVTDNSPYTVQAYVDSAARAAVVGNTLDVSALAPGSHTLHVNATDAAGNASGWVTWDFVNGPPVLSSVVVTDAVSVDLAWIPVGGATSYDYTINGGSVLSTTSAGITLTGLTGGVTTIQVRTVFGVGDPSDWAEATVTDNVVVPTRPVISAPAMVWDPSVAVSWAAVAYARAYEYRVDGGASTLTTATTVSASLDTTGSHTLEVRALNNLRQSDWVTATVIYRPRVTPTLTISASSSRIAYPTGAFVLTGYISAPSALVRLQASIDGVNWTDASTWTSAASPIPVALSLGLARSTSYRFVFDGDSQWTPLTSAAVSVAYAPRVGTPGVSGSLKKNRAFTVSNIVSAPAANRSAIVTFQFSRYEKVRGRNTWVLRKSATVKGSVASSTSMKYKASVKLPYAGKWRAIAVYNGAPMYASASSGAKALSVK